MPQIAKVAGAEFILFDMEHTALDLPDVKRLVACCRGLELPPYVRVPATDYHFIAHALDAGATGIMVPMVETAEQAEFIVSCTRYPPAGRRGAAFGFAHDDYTGGDVAAKIAAADARTLVMALIETERGAANVEAIAAVPGIDVLWLGHFDLTSFMGIPGQFTHPRYLAAVDAIVAAARRHGKAAGVLAPTWPGVATTSPRGSGRSRTASITCCSRRRSPTASRRCVARRSRVARVERQRNPGIVPSCASPGFRWRSTRATAQPGLPLNPGYRSTRATGIFDGCNRSATMNDTGTPSASA